MTAFTKALKLLTYYGPTDTSKRMGYKKVKVSEIGSWELYRKKKVRINKGGKSTFGDFDIRTAEAIKKGMKKFNDKDRGALFLAISENIISSRFSKRKNAYRKSGGPGLHYDFSNDPGAHFNSGALSTGAGSQYLSRLNAHVIKRNLTAEEAYHKLHTDILRVTATGRTELLRHYIKGVGMKVALLLKGNLKVKQSDLTKLKWEQAYKTKELKRNIFQKMQAMMLSLRDIIGEILDNSPLWQMIRAWDKEQQEKIKSKYLNKHKFNFV